MRGAYANEADFFFFLCLRTGIARLTCHVRALCDSGGPQMAAAFFFLAFEAVYFFHPTPFGVFGCLAAEFAAFPGTTGWCPLF